MAYTVDAVSEAMKLLFLVAETPDKGVTELAKLSGNTKARAFRLLTTLEQSGMVQRTWPVRRSVAAITSAWLMANTSPL